MTLEIAELGNPILSQHAAKVRVFAGAELAATTQQMMLMMTELNGVGIAAPQLSISQQIVIIASRPNQRYPDAPLMEPLVMVNPEILDQSSETKKGWEGCLSVPGIRGYVARSIGVEVGYMDIEGHSHQLVLDEFPARIFLHEYDHLIGLTFLDRVDSTADLASEKELAARLA
ncbi:MAG: peptide deformylase [Moraxellaceae bacterium]|nr:MAG: peptide deformylase [Moraxellaceae bacterium]